MRKKLLWTIVLVPIVISALMATAATTPGTWVYIDPPYQCAPCINAQFSIDIRVQDVDNLWGYQFWLGFNSSIIHGVSVENGPFLGSAGGWVLVAPGEGFDNEVGELKLYGASIYMGYPPQYIPDVLLPDGDGVLATVTFKVVGYGVTEIVLGDETGLMDKYGEWLFYGEGGSGYFKCTPEAPELYIRTRGAHGTSGIWPEWHVGLPCWTETLYCEVFNYGTEMGAWIEVKFVVRYPDGSIEEYISEQVWIDPAPEKGVPSSVIVAVSFHPGIVGKYYVYGMLYFKIACMPEKVPYYLCEEYIGGEGISREINVAFKVQEHL